MLDWRSVTWLRFAAAAGVVGSLAQNAWVFENLVARRTDILYAYVSDLGAKTERNWWFWTAADEVAGVLTIVFAVAVIPLYRELERRATLAVLGAVAYLLSGMGTIADGILRLPCPQSLSASCQARIAAGDVGWMYRGHQVESVFTGVVTVIAIVLLAWALLGDSRWRGAGRWMWYLMPQFVVVNLFTGVAAAFDVAWPGLLGRLLLVSSTLSSLPPMIRLWQLAPDYERERLSPAPA
jgi:hypothetical membrane protein